MREMGRIEGWAGVIGVIWYKGGIVGQHDRDRVSSDQGFLIGDRGTINQIRDA